MFGQGTGDKKHSAVGYPARLRSSAAAQRQGWGGGLERARASPVEASGILKSARGRLGSFRTKTLQLVANRNNVGQFFAGLRGEGSLFEEHGLETFRKAKRGERKYVYDEEDGEGFPSLHYVPLNWDDSKAQQPPAREAIHLAKRAGRYYEMKLTKVLGLGGYAAVALYTLTAPDGREKKIVGKVFKDDDPHHRNLEESFLTRFKGSKHIMQIIDGTEIRKREKPKLKIVESKIFGGLIPLPKLPKVPREDAEESYKSSSTSELSDLDAPSVMFLEYLEWGDLWGWVTRRWRWQQGPGFKATRVYNRFSNKVLWIIWECLVRGVVGIKYPPTGHSAGRLEEPRARAEDSHIVHFDIDLLNIMMGGDPADHPSCPIFKIGDFGVAIDMKEFWKWTDRRADSAEAEMEWWGHRRRGKILNYTPEQFTGEWDELRYGYGYIPFKADSDPKTKVAGRYDSWTNIYQIGRAMWMLITGRQQELPLRSTTHPTLGPTYGGLVLGSSEFAYCDEELRRMVAHCMCESPEARPTATELFANCRERFAQGFKETDEETLAFFQDSLFVPVPVGCFPESDDEDNSSGSFGSKGSIIDMDVMVNKWAPKIEEKLMSAMGEDMAMGELAVRLKEVENTLRREEGEEVRLEAEGVLKREAVARNEEILMQGVRQRQKEAQENEEVGRRLRDLDIHVEKFNLGVRRDSLAPWLGPARPLPVPPGRRSALARKDENQLQRKNQQPLHRQSLQPLHEKDKQPLKPPRQDQQLQPKSKGKRPADVPDVPHRSHTSNANAPGEQSSQKPGSKMKTEDIYYVHKVKKVRVSPQSDLPSSNFLR